MKQKYKIVYEVERFFYEETHGGGSVARHNWGNSWQSKSEDTYDIIKSRDRIAKRHLYKIDVDGERQISSSSFEEDWILNEIPSPAESDFEDLVAPPNDFFKGSLKKEVTFFFEAEIKNLFYDMEEYIERGKVRINGQNQKVHYTYWQFQGYEMPENAVSDFCLSTMLSSENFWEVVEKTKKVYPKRYNFYSTERWIEVLNLQPGETIGNADSPRGFDLVVE